MTDAIVPNILRDDRLLTPEIINRNFQRLLEQQKQAMDRRWTFDTVIVPFVPGATQASNAALLSARLQVSHNCRVIGRELYVYADQTMKLGITGITADLEAAGNGSGTISVARDLESVHLAADDDLELDLTSDAATWTLTAGWAVIHIAHDRHDGDGPEGSASAVLSSDTPAAAATKVNNALTSLAGVNTSLAANEARQSISCVLFGDRSFTSISADAQDIPVPDDGGTIKAIAIAGTWDATLTVTATLYDATSTPVQAAALAGGTASGLVDYRRDCDEAMDGDDCNAADDYYITLSLSGSGTCYHLYVFIIWE